jgi:biopolymer transport protein ExbD
VKSRESARNRSHARWSDRYPEEEVAVANIQVPGGGARRAVDSEVPLVPFIDLLLCAVMFLLVTAVWNQLGSLTAAVPGDDRREDAVTEEPDVLYVQIRSDGYLVASTDGVRVVLPNVDGQYDVVGLRNRLHSEHAQRAGATITITSDDGIAYREIAEVMDVATGAGFDQLALAPLPVP